MKIGAQVKRAGSRGRSSIESVRERAIRAALQQLAEQQQRGQGGVAGQSGESLPAAEDVDASKGA